jgi:hypothetical protein
MIDAEVSPITGYRRVSAQGCSTQLRGAAHSSGVQHIALRDMTHDADMGRSGLDVTMAVMSAQVTAIPGAAQQRRELARLAAEHVDDGCEFFREQEEAAIGDGLLISWGKRGDGEKR